MSVIICECGHQYHGLGGCVEQCGCILTPHAVEARYWARRMKSEQYAMRIEIDALRAKLDVAIEALRNIVGDYRDSYSIAFDALKELEDK